MRWNVYLAAVDLEVAVGDELARLGAGVRKAQPVDRVVETHLEELEEGFAGLAWPLGSFGEEAAELALQQAVGATDLLLLAQLHAAAGELAGAALAVLAGACVAALDGAFAAHAAIALKEELHAFTSAQAADGTGVSCHAF